MCYFRRRLIGSLVVLVVPYLVVTITLLLVVVVVTTSNGNRVHGSEDCYFGIDRFPHIIFVLADTARVSEISGTSTSVFTWPLQE